MEKRTVFISYKSEDIETARWLRSVLETNRISCWMAPADIPGGSSYAVEIPAAIEQCEIMVVVLSSHTQDSVWVPKELDQGINRGKVIMPFMVDNISLRDDFNFYLSNVQRYTAYENKTIAAEKMIREIRAVLESRCDSARPAASEGEALKGPAAHVTENRKPGEKIWIALLAVLLILGIGAGVWFSGLIPLPSSTPSDTQALPAKKPDYHITLAAPDTMNVRSFNQAIETIRERLNLLTGDQEYLFQIQDNAIHLTLPSSCFSGLVPESVLRCYISRPVNLYFRDLEDSSVTIPVKRDDLESVLLKNGSPEGVDISAYGISSPVSRYLEIHLTDSFVSAHSSSLSSWKKPTLVQDAEEFSNYYFYCPTLPSADPGVWYLLNQDPGEQFILLNQYNYTHPALPAAFSFLLDLNTTASWQVTPETDSFGKNQCLPEEFSASTVTFLLKAGKRTAGELLDFQAVLKTRLDAFGTPYAFGQTKDPDDNVQYVIRMAQDHMGQALMDSLRANYSLKLRSGYKELSLSFSSLILTPDESGSGFTISVNESSYNYDRDTESLKKMGQALTETDDPPVLILEDLPLLVADRETLIRSGVMHIAALCDSSEGRITGRALDDSTAWVRDYITAVLQGPKLPFTPALGNYQINAGNDGNPEEGNHFVVSNELNSQFVLSRIQAICPTAEYRRSSNEISLFLHLPVDQSLPSRAAEMAEQIYKALDFEHLSADSLSLYLIDEDDKAGERARIFFRKAFNTVYSDPDETVPGAPYTYGILKGGRLSDLGKLFLETINGIEFFQSLTHDSTYWITE